MIFLKCASCKDGEVDIVGNDRAINKKTKCRQCGHTNAVEPRMPEVIIMRKRSFNGEI